MLLALATCADLASRETDDVALHAALARRGIAFERPAWDDPEVDWSRFASVLIRTTWDYQHRVQAFCAWAHRVGGAARLFNPAAVVRWNTHKRYLRELEVAGVPTVPTIWLEAGASPELGALAASFGAEEAVLKPCVGATARETLRFRVDGAGLAAARAHADRLLGSEDLMLQPFLASVTDRGEWSGVFFGGRLTHAARKIPSLGDYRVQRDFGATDASYVPTRAELAAAESALRTAERLLDTRLLYARADWLWRDDGRPVLGELELVEPELYFRHGRGAEEVLIDAWLAAI